VGHLTEFDGKPLQSVAKGDVSLDEMSETESKDQKEAQQKKEEQFKSEFDDVIKRIKSTLGDQIKDARLSHRLTQSPACLVSDDNEMGSQLQRLLKAAGQDVADIKPIFELNPEHRLVMRLKTESDVARFQELVTILFDQAILAEGGQLKDPAVFVSRINKLLLESIAGD